MASDQSDLLAEDVVIDVRSLGKSYRIFPKPADRFRQAFAWGRRQYYREFPALHNVSFQVRRGEMIGIIGRNGSGKSTLLQIIAGTLRPTYGEVTVRGRVAALLELGSGFDIDATGRENVFMNSALLGLTTEQTRGKYDRITAFADIGQFIDQPVRTYSSGMFVRLAFAVAAHVDADVLIVDEALAVGDEAFQRKCFGYLERFQEEGGTVLLVTHGTQLVVRLCWRAFLLDAGEVVAHGSSKPVVDTYQKLLYGSPEQVQRLREALARAGGQADQVQLTDPAEDAGDQPHEPDHRAPTQEEEQSDQAYYDPGLVSPAETTYGTGEAEIMDVCTLDARGRRANVLQVGQPCELRYRVRFDAAAVGVRFGIMIKTTDGVDLAGISNVHLGDRLERAECGQEYVVRFRLTLNLAPGVYFLNSGVSALRDGEETYLHRRVDVAAFRVVPRDERDIYGLAFVNPELTYSCEPP